MGYRTWTTGDTVSAADFSSYIANQCVFVFTNTTARDAAITSPSTGMLAYTSADDKLFYYSSGAAWVETSLTADITGLTAGNLVDITDDTGPVPTINVDLSEASTSTTDGDGDFFIVVDAANAQYKLTKANIALSGMNNDSGWTTNTGDVTGVTAGTNIDVTDPGGPTPTVDLAIDAAVAFGSDGSGVDTTWHSGTASDNMAWSESNVCLTITGTDSQDSLVIADGDVSITDALTVTGTTTTYLNVLTDSTTTRTPSLTDAGAYILTTHGTGITVTLPQDSAVAFPVGTVIYFERNGSGTLTFAAGTGATVNSKDATLTCGDRYTTVAAVKIAADTWTLIGNIG